MQSVSRLNVSKPSLAFRFLLRKQGVTRLTNVHLWVYFLEWADEAAAHADVVLKGFSFPTSHEVV